MYPPAHLHGSGVKIRDMQTVTHRTGTPDARERANYHEKRWV